MEVEVIASRDGSAGTLELGRALGLAGHSRHRNRSTWRPSATRFNSHSPSAAPRSRPRRGSRPGPAIGRRDLQQSPRGDPPRPHPDPTAPAARPAKGGRPRPGVRGHKRGLPARCGRWRGREPRRDGLRGHPTERCGPHARSTRRTRRRGDRRPRLQRPGRPRRADAGALRLRRGRAGRRGAIQPARPPANESDRALSIAGLRRHA